MGMDTRATLLSAGLPPDYVVRVRASPRCAQRRLELLGQVGPLYDLRPGEQVEEAHPLAVLGETYSRSLPYLVPA